MKAEFLQKALHWATQFEQIVYLNPNQIDYPHEPFLHVLACGAKRIFIPSFTPEATNFDRLYQFWQQHPSWLFGYFSYDLKNELENLHSANPDKLNFPIIYFFEPLHLLFFNQQGNLLNQLDHTILQEIEQTEIKNFERQHTKKEIYCNFSKENYLQTVEFVRSHIREGDVYELNLCIDFFIENISLEPISTYFELVKRSPMPFSAFLKVGDKFALCASPERFLKKQQQQLISQPIKGTVRRGKTHEEDEALKNYLRTSEKERAENMMIVDLVRNDLARSAKIGSTHASEIFGIYSFEQVSQMISTVKAELHKDYTWADAIANAFPMGSMTGAPKLKAMQLIENYEKNKRGLYSGAIGYITPEGDFDLNVVIRSLFYDSIQHYASFQVGGAITYDSIPENEWEECVLKAKAIRSLFE